MNLQVSQGETMIGRFVKENIPGWLIHLSRYFWRASGFFWGTIVLSLAINIFSALIISGSNLTKLLNGTPIAWLFQNPSILITIGTILLSLTSITGLLARLDSTSEIKRNYLRRLIAETEQIHLSGIQVGLITESTRLDEIFIPLEFRSSRPRIDYPLTDEELKNYRQNLASGLFSNDLERILIDAEQNWQRLVRTNDRVSIGD